MVRVVVKRLWRENVVDGARKVFGHEVRSRRLSESEEWHGHMSQNTLNTLKSDKREDNEHPRKRSYLHDNRGLIF
jgi:hypothetical protein